MVADLKNPQLSELTDSTVLDITYLLFGDGFALTPNRNYFTTSRYTMRQQLEQSGTVSHTLDLKYPYMGTDDDVLRTKFVEGSEWDIFERPIIDNSVPLADGQLLSIAAPVRCDAQDDIPKTANTEIGKQQRLLPRGTIETDVIIGGAGVTGWTLEVTGTPAGGTYSLTVNGFETAPIAHNATAAAVKAAIDGLSGVTGITVTASGSAPIALTFSAKATLTADGSNLTGGTSPTVVVAKA